MVTQTDIILRKSGGPSNSNGNLSLGGSISTFSLSTDVLHGLWDEIDHGELTSSIVGENEVRCIYLYNANLTNETIKNVWFWLGQNTASPFSDVDVALGTSGIGGIEQTVENENVQPRGVVWSFARSEEEAIFIGDIPPGSWQAIWIRRHAGPAPVGTSYPADNYILNWKFSKIGEGGPTPPPPPTPPGPPGPGPSPPPPPTTGQKDPFGVSMIYPTNSSTTVSRPFYIDAVNPINSVCRFSYQGSTVLSSNSDGSLTTGDGARLRCWISDVSGCNRDTLWEASKTANANHDMFGERGYMYQPNDWKNIEITCYWKVLQAGTEVESGRKLYLYSRTWRHNNDFSCLGSAYKGVVYGDGTLKFHKESFHGGGQPCNDRSIWTIPNKNIGRTDNNQWFGMKVMMWNIDNPNSSNPGSQWVHLELWIDRQADDRWVKIGDRNDEGSWYPGAPDTNCPGDTFCGGNQDQIIIWGGPLTEGRVDGYPLVNFKWLSVREIIPPTTFPPPGPIPPPLPPTPPGTPPSPPPPEGNIKHTVSSVTAKGNQEGNIPQNVIDGNLTTRWSHEPIPSWINLNLGSIKNINQVRIAWYNGNTRTIGFSIKVENEDGADKVTVFEGTSSGTTTQLETYNLTQSLNRQKVIIDILTNTANQWASITEVEIYGDAVPIPPPPPGTPPPAPPPPTPPTPSPDPTLDEFGVKMIYASKSGANHWSATTWNNGRNRTIKRNPDITTGNCIVDPDDSRFKMSNCCNPEVNINGSGIMKTYNMPGTSDGTPRVMIAGTWQNVEQTAYIKASSATGAAGNVDFRSKTDHYCVTNGDDFGGYIHNISWVNDEVSQRREISHSIGYSDKHGIVPFTFNAGVWYGIKAICYNMANGQVKLETWIDTTDGASGGTWNKISEVIDDGTWGGAGGGPPAGVTKSCGGSALRSNLGGANGEIEFKKMTVREIVPPIGSTLWTSSKWSNGHARTFFDQQRDPDDNIIHYTGDGTEKCEVDGNGTLKMTGVTPRIYILVNNTKTTLTTHVTANATLGTINLNVRSRHTPTIPNYPCNFGGYECHFDWSSQSVYITKEPVHGIFGNIQNETFLSGFGITLGTGTPIGLRAKVETLSDGSVKVSTFIEHNGVWTFIMSYTDTVTNDDGTANLSGSELDRFNECASEGDMITSSVSNMYKPWTNPGVNCWIRANADPITDPVTDIIFTDSYVEEG